MNTVHNYEKWELEKLRDEEHPLLPYNVTEPVVIRSFLPEGVCVAKNSEEDDESKKPEGVCVAKNPEEDDESKKPEEGGETGNPTVKMSGRLLGGCMDCLVNLTGTRFDRVTEFAERYANDGILWFLEACDLNLMSIRRAIWQMKHAGWFSHVKGFLIGRPLCRDEEMFGLDRYRAVTDLLAEYQVPIVMDLDIGHLPPMMPLVCGGTAEVTLTGFGADDSVPHGPVFPDDGSQREKEGVPDEGDFIPCSGGSIEINYTWR